MHVLKAPGGTVKATFTFKAFVEGRFGGQAKDQAARRDPSGDSVAKKSPHHALCMIEQLLLASKVRMCRITVPTGWRLRVGFLDIVGLEIRAGDPDRPLKRSTSRSSSSVQEKLAILVGEQNIGAKHTHLKL
ncbi:hypothetical protein VNI00_012257 [Paramarasmius palmivorus]|uniref:Uncharacterized protein n=1 Tax=Paramarasmius palmivorus TaxID=297713 RepID=A0AAW0C6R4_9AGAR